MKKIFSFIAFAAMLVLSLTTLSYAQARTGNIEGIVKDPQGNVIPNAQVKATGSNIGFNRTVQTDDSGQFRIQQVPPGIYLVEVTASGFAIKTAENVTVNLEQNSTINFDLQISGSQAEVTVSGDDVPAIDTQSNTIQTSINERASELVPKQSPNFASLIRVSPAVREEPLGAGFQIDGASGAENTFIVDGLEVTNFRTGQLRNTQNIPNDFISEVQVKTSGFDAEFGGATGGVITVVTKGGSNNFNGQVGTQFEVSQFNGNTRPFLRNQSGSLEVFNPSRSGGGSNFLNPPDTEYTFFFPTARFSGPIAKDRLWFFVSAAPQSLDFTRNRIFPDGRFQQDRASIDRDYYFGRLDGQVSDKLRLTGTYTYNPETQNGQLEPFSTTAPIDLSQRGGRVQAQNFTYQGTFTPNQTFVFNVRGGRNFVNEQLGDSEDERTGALLGLGTRSGSFGIPQVTRTRVLGVSSVVPANFGRPFGSDTGDNNVISRDVSIRNTFDADASVNFLFGGRHLIKGGYQLNKVRNDVANGFFDTGRIDFFFGQTSRGIGGGTGQLGNIQLTRFGTVGLAASTNQAIFIQDNYQPFRRLTLNLGFRIEKEEVPSFSENGQPIEFGFGDKPAPRIGGAFDVFGDGKTKIFASFGRFYDRFKFELPRGSFGGDQFLRTFIPIPAGANVNNFTVQSILATPGALTLDFRVPSNSPDDNRIDPDLKAQRQTEFTVGVERELFRDLTLRARYTTKTLDETVEDVGFFDNEGNENFFIANPGRGVVAQPFASGIPGTPRAERKYRVLEIATDRRFANNFYLNASYSFSRLTGNYSGLASSDERGRSSPNVNRFFDLPFLGFTLNGEPDNGRLATDRPHAFKAFGGYTVRYNSSNETDFTGAFIGQSGTPLSTRISLFNAQTFVFGRGDLGRTETFTQTDFAITHRYRFGRDNRFTLVGELNVTNLLNEENELDRFTTISPDDVAGQITQNFAAAGGVPAGTATFNLFTNCPSGDCDELDTIRAVFNGGLQSQILALINGTRTFTARDENGNTRTLTTGFSRDARYNQPQSFQNPREVRFGVRFQF